MKPSVSQSSVLKIVFGPHENAKPALLNSSGLKDVFEKLRCAWRISVDVRLNSRTKAAFSIFYAWCRWGF